MDLAASQSVTTSAGSSPAAAPSSNGPATGRFDANFDSQKLQFHPCQVARWLADGFAPGPIYTEMELANRCQCRCIFCGVDHLIRPDGEMIGAESAERVIAALADLGNQSIMFCGNGEPLLNTEAQQIVRSAGRRMSVSMTTNGLALAEGNIGLLDDLEWIRFSINGYSPDNYARLHHVAPSCFGRALQAVAAAVERRNRLGLKAVIGVQLVLLPGNASGAPELARRVRDIGVDYFAVKPYSQHPLSRNRLQIDYRQLADVEQALAPLAADRFRVIFRAGSMVKLNRPKSYDACYGTEFLCFVSADGDVWECNVFAGDPRFLIGNALRDDLRQLWAGPRRREVLAFLRERWDLSQCRDVCRMDECNRYLWRLKHPWPHDNFI